MWESLRKEPKSRRSDRRGVVLISILAILVFVAAILFAFVEEATTRIKHSALFFEQDDLRYEAYSYLDLTLAVLAEIHSIDGAFYGPNQGWRDPLGYAEVTPEDGLEVLITVEDETSRLPLQRVTQDEVLLRAAFEELGFRSREQDDLLGALVDWTDEGDEEYPANGAEADWYERRGFDYKPPNQPIRSWDEFRLIKGFNELFFTAEGLPLPVFEQFRSAFSLYSEQMPNENTARPFVQRILSRVDSADREFYLNDYLAGPDLIRGTEDDRYVRNADQIVLSPSLEGGEPNLTTELFRVSVEVVRGDARFLLETLVEYGETGGGPAIETRTADEDFEDLPDMDEDEIDEQGEELTVGEGGRERGSTPSYPFRVIRLHENGRVS